MARALLGCLVLAGCTPLAAAQEPAPVAEESSATAVSQREWLVAGTFKGSTHGGLRGTLSNFIFEYENDDSLFRDFGDLGIGVGFDIGPVKTDEMLVVEFAGLGEPLEMTEEVLRQGFLDYRSADSERGLTSEFASFDDRVLAASHGNPFTGRFEQARYFYEILVPRFWYKPTKRGFTVLLRMVNPSGVAVSEEQQILAKPPPETWGLVPEVCWQVPEGASAETELARAEPMDGPARDQLALGLRRAPAGRVDLGIDHGGVDGHALEPRAELRFDHEGDHQAVHSAEISEEDPLVDGLGELGVVEDPAVHGDLEERLGVEVPGLLLAVREGDTKLLGCDAVHVARAEILDRQSPRSVVEEHRRKE